MNSTDLLTKLLAKENITILRQNVRTASFDIKNRTLRLPVLLNLSEAEEFMMSLHEVGHALYTDESYMDFIKTEEQRRNFSSYMNVLEDIRIEKMIKEYYPGVRKDFFVGYKELNERDFFGISGADLSKMNLIDRINIHFKVGFRAGVRFTEQERELVFRAERTQTLRDVYDLALDVYDLAVEQKKLAKSFSNDVGEDDSLDEEDEFDYDFEDEPREEEYNSGVEDEYEENQKQVTKSSGNDYSDDGEDDAPEAKTQRKFDESVEQIKQSDAQEVQYLVPGISGIVQQVSYGEILSVIDEKVEEATKKFEEDKIRFGFSNQVHKFQNPYYENKWNKFRSSNNKAVAHLFKEFEMKKAARRYSRSQVASTGSLNMRKIHEYKTDGDIFAKLQSVYDDNSHSFLMMLDWSGSMDDNLCDSAGQVITLASFCRRAKIPFQVIAFRDSDLYRDTCPPECINLPDGINGLTSSGRIEFLTLFDSKMSNADFDKMSKFVYCKYLSSINRFALSSTPLVQAVSWLYNYIPKFQKSVNTEKTTLIIVTDGEANSTFSVTKEGRNIGQYSRDKVFVRCKYTGKLYPFSREPSEQMHTILNMIGNAFPELVRVGFFISQASHRSLRTFNMIYGEKIDTREISIRMREKYFCEYPTSSYNKLFVIPAATDNAGIDLGRVTNNMTPSQISKTLNKAIGNVLNSRVVLTKFIESIA